MPRVEEENIAKLLDRVRKRERSAQDELYRTYRRDVRATAFGLVRSDADADDIVQEVFVKFLTGILPFDGKSMFRTWLIRVTRNCSLDLIRRRNKGRVILGAVRNDDEDSGSFDISVTCDPTSDISEMEDYEELSRAVTSLPDTDANVVRLHVAGFTNEESAQVLGISRKNLYNRRTRAFRRLREVCGDFQRHSR